VILERSIVSLTKWLSSWDDVSNMNASSKTRLSPPWRRRETPDLPEREQQEQEPPQGSDPTQNLILKSRRLYSIFSS